jgi:hypothetical protein
MTSRPLLAASLATLLSITGLLAVAAPAQAAPATTICDAIANQRAVNATCDTVLLALGIVVGEALCLLNTAPINWVAVCGAISIGPLPIVTYLLCYYNTAPANWVANCV